MGISCGEQVVYNVDNKHDVPHKITYLVGNMYPQDIQYILCVQYIYCGSHVLHQVLWVTLYILWKTYVVGNISSGYNVYYPVGNNVISWVRNLYRGYM